MLPLKISTPMAVLVLAGAVVVSATTGAVAGSLVTGAQIKNESLTGKDVKNGSLKAVDLADGVGEAGPAGPPGAPGAAGAPGTPGTPGTDGVSDYEIVHEDLTIAIGDDDNEFVACPTGLEALSVTAGWVDSGTADDTYLRSDLSETGALVIYQNFTSFANRMYVDLVCAQTS